MTTGQAREHIRETKQNLLPGEENILMSGVSSDGLLRWAICSLLPVGPGTPPCGGGCCELSIVDVHVKCEDVYDRVQSK
jgi:hypothetical protein